MHDLVEKQITSFQNALNIVGNTINSPCITIRKGVCDMNHAPYGFPNSFQVDYTLIPNSFSKATMGIQINSSDQGLSFVSIEIVDIDANPRRRGMGRELFEQAKSVGKALGIDKIYGTILDDDAAKFYKAIGCKIEGRTFRYFLSQCDSSISK